MPSSIETEGRHDGEVYYATCPKKVGWIVSLSTVCFQFYSLVHQGDSH
jgi:hypothetical protein